MNTKNKVHLFLDSGAFSAYTLGIEINIYEYIEFIKQHKNIIDMYANLDVIATGNTLNDKKYAAEKTLQNQKIMEEAGLSPLPVFHVGEPLEYLKFYIKNYEYIGLGGMVRVPKPTLIHWLDDCFGEYICGQDGMPTVKVHGFGLASIPLMLRYPWYSVDSTAWVVNSRLGRVLIPEFRGGKWIYDENTCALSVSSTSPYARKAGQHISNISPKRRQIVLDYFHNKGYKLGKSRFEKVSQSHELVGDEKWAEKKPTDKTAKRLLEIIEEPGLCNKYQLRDELNIIYFQDLENFIPEWPWSFKRKGVRGFAL